MLINAFFAALSCGLPSQHHTVLHLTLTDPVLIGDGTRMVAYEKQAGQCTHIQRGVSRDPLVAHAKLYYETHILAPQKNIELCFKWIDAMGNEFAAHADRTIVADSTSVDFTAYGLGNIHTPLPVQVDFDWCATCMHNGIVINPLCRHPDACTSFTQATILGIKSLLFRNNTGFIDRAEWSIFKECLSQLQSPPDALTVADLVVFMKSSLHSAWGNPC